VTSEPISGLPAGTPADSNELPQAIPTVATQRITLLQLFNYMAQKSLNNTVYQNYATGIDATTSGSILVPYKTVAYAMSQITAATATNPYTLKTLGGYSNETAQISLKPYVNWEGETQNTVINNSLQIILDVSTWSANLNASMYIESLTIAGNLQEDFSTLTNSSASLPIIQHNNLRCIGTYYVNGNSNNNPKIYNYTSLFGTCNLDNLFLYSKTSTYTILNIGTSSSVNAVFAVSQSDIIIDLTCAGPISSGVGNVVYVTGCSQLASLVSNGTHCAVYYDSSSVFAVSPTSANGGVLIQLDEGQNIESPGIRTNYSPTSGTVEGNFAGIDSALGSISGGVNLPNNAVALGQGSPGLKTVTGLNYSGILTVPDGIQVTNDSSLPFVLMGDGGLNNSPIFAYNGPFGYFSNANTGDGILRHGDSTKAWRIGVGTSNSQISLTDTVFQVGILNSAGVVHTDSSGNFSTSLIVDADVNSSANITLSKINTSKLGDGYHLASMSGGTVTLTNPSPNFVSIQGTSGILQLPPMNASNSLSINNNSFIFLWCQTTGSVTVETNTGATNYGTLTNGQSMILFPIDTSTADGHFITSYVSLNASSPLSISGGVISMPGITSTASALLSMASTTQGFNLPSMSTTNMNSISSPANGLMIYDNVVNAIRYYNGTAWSTSSGFDPANYTSSFTMTNNYENILVNNPASTPITVTLPLLSTVVPGTKFRITRISVNSSNTITVQANGSDVWNPSGSHTIIGQYTYVSVVSCGTFWLNTGNTG
jgi:hypothetical protein